MSKRYDNKMKEKRKGKKRKESSEKQRAMA